MDRGATRHRAANQSGKISGEQEPGDVRFPGPALAEQENELARCEWIGRRANVLVVGNRGTGKTHIGLALGLAACQQGFRVGFTTTAAPVHELIEAPDGTHLLRHQEHLARQKLLIVDELGFVPLSKTSAEMLLEVFSQRYERLLCW